jgi:hypothetical protein
MQHRLMANGTSRTNCQGTSGIGMQDAIFLDITASPHGDRVIVTAQDRAKPD